MAHLELGGLGVGDGHGHGQVLLLPHLDEAVIVRGQAQGQGLVVPRLGKFHAHLRGMTIERARRRTPGGTDMYMYK